MPNKTISLTQDAYDYIMDYKGNKSDFISNLILEYVGDGDRTNLEKLEKKKAEYWKEREILDLKISQIQSDITRLREEEIEKEMRAKKEDLLREFKLEHEDWNLLFKNNKISDEEYWAGVEERKRKKEDLLKDFK